MANANLIASWYYPTVMWNVIKARQHKATFIIVTECVLMSRQISFVWTYIYGTQTRSPLCLQRSCTQLCQTISRYGAYFYNDAHFLYRFCGYLLFSTPLEQSPLFEMAVETSQNLFRGTSSIDMKHLCPLPQVPQLYNSISYGVTVAINSGPAPIGINHSLLFWKMNAWKNMVCSKWALWFDVYAGHFLFRFSQVLFNPMGLELSCPYDGTIFSKPFS